MKRPTEKFTRLACVIGVVAALGFGTQQALAKTATLCGPPTYQSCFGHPDCQEFCDWWDPGTTGWCQANCCNCFL